MESKPIKTSPKDFFLNLLIIITLYTAAASFVALIFQYIDIAFPDVLEGGSYYIRSAYSSIRWSLSSLIVVFPIYILTSWFLEKGYKKIPEKRNLRVRRWLIYFTLFAAASIIIGDFVALIFNFLGGELTTRFVLKLLTIFVVSGAIFGYYFYDIYQHKIE